MKIGYARVSREEQNLDRQITALNEVGCELIYADKIGGAHEKRPELDKMLEVLQPGDCVVIQKLDRLGRSLEHLIGLVKKFKGNGVAFVSLTDHIDTNTAVGELIFHVLGAVAQFEKVLIKERVKDGLKQARVNGKILGPPKKDFSEEVKRFEEVKDKPVEEVMELMKVSRSKYFRLKKLSK